MDAAVSNQPILTVERSIAFMESTPISLLVLVPVTAATLVLLWTWRRRQRRRLPPGPWGVPILGSLPFVDPELHRYFADIAAKHGPVSSLRLGSRLYVLISSPSAAMEVVKVHDTVFASRPFFHTMHAFNDGVDIVMTPHGPLWRLLRRVAVKDVFGPTILDSFAGLCRRVILGMISELKSKVGTEVNIRDTLDSVTLNLMLGMIWEGSLEEEKGSCGIKRELSQVVHSISELMAAPNISDFFPALAALDLQGLQGKMKALSARYGGILDPIMRERAPSGSAAAKEGRVGDLITLLVDLINNKEPQMPLELVHARGIIFDMLEAGTGSTPSAVEWAMSQLLRHPEITAKVKAELDVVVGRGGVVEERHIPKLEYLNAVLKETLRVHPVVPLLARAPRTTCEVGGYTVPEGAAVIVNLWAIHRDPSVWEEPLEFRPERFLDRKDEVRNVDGKSFDYLPFGRGRRMCAGMNLAERTMALLLASLLHAFQWRLPRGCTTVDVEERFGFTAKKKDPLVLVPAFMDIELPEH